MNKFNVSTKPKDCGECGEALPLPRYIGTMFHAECAAARSAAKRLALTEGKWNERHPTIPYLDYLAMRAPGVCHICGATREPLSMLHADDDGGVLRGVYCGGHGVYVRAVRAGTASPLAVLATYLTAVTA